MKNAVLLLAECDYDGYMNGGYLNYFNPFTMEGHLD